MIRMGNQEWWKESHADPYNLTCSHQINNSAKRANFHSLKSFIFPTLEELIEVMFLSVRANASPSNHSAAETHRNTRKLILSLFGKYEFSPFYCIGFKDSHYSNIIKQLRNFGTYRHFKIFPFQEGAKNIFQN